MLDVGVVGAGRIGHKTHAPLVQALEDTSLAFVADIHRDRARKVADRFSTAPVTIEDPSDLPACDAVVLAIPVGVRAPYYRELADRGIAVFSEKPFAVDTKRHEAWSGIADQVSCNYIRLEYGPTAQIKSLVDSGALGELRSVEYRKHFFGPSGISPGSYEMDPELAGGGLLMEYGIHILAELDEIFDDGSITVEKSTMTFDDGLDVDTRLNLAGSTASGRAPIDLHLSWDHPEAHLARYEFEGGTLSWNLMTPEATIVVEGTDPPIELRPWKGAPSNNKEATARRLNSFVKHVLADEPHDESRPQVSEIVEKAYARAEERR